MPNVTIYSFRTKQRTVVPLAELAPGWIKARLASETGGPDEIVWVNPKEAPQESIVRHPPFDEARRRIIRDIQGVFYEVRPATFEDWELGFRCDLDPDAEITLWRWMADRFTRLTSAKRLTRAKKKDLLQLLLAWVSCRNVDEVVASLLPLPAMSEAEARELLSLFPHTPLDFFGGATQKLAEILELDQRRTPALDFGCIRSLEDFRAATDLADLIVAVDYRTGDFEIVFGCDRLPGFSGGELPKSDTTTSLVDPLAGTGKWCLSQREEGLAAVMIALDFDADNAPCGTRLEALCAAVIATKGCCWLGGEKHTYTPGQNQEDRNSD